MPRAALAVAPNVIAGAIRWDAWYSQSDSSAVAAQNALSPQQWQFRAPWFAKVSNPYMLRTTGTQADMDLECQFAANAGLKYWTFDRYPSGSGFTVAWNLYQSSLNNNLVNWCWMTDDSVLGSTSNYTAAVNLLVSQFQQSNYQKVLTNRPLMYWNQTAISGYWGGNYANLSPALAALQSACTSAGLGNPYIVICGGLPGASNLATLIGAGAVSAYLPLTPVAAQPNPYSALVESAEGFWTQMASYFSTIVPCCATGWDTRPRKQNPVPWDVASYAPAYSRLLNYVTPGTPSQIAGHIQDAVNYVIANPSKCPSTAILIYSWTECDEGGGCMIPTLGDPPQTGNTTNLLTAISAVLK